MAKPPEQRESTPDEDDNRNPQELVSNVPEDGVQAESAKPNETKELPLDPSAIRKMVAAAKEESLNAERWPVELAPDQPGCPNNPFARVIKQEAMGVVSIQIKRQDGGAPITGIIWFGQDTEAKPKRKVRKKVKLSRTENPENDLAGQNPSERPVPKNLQSLVGERPGFSDSFKSVLSAASGDSQKGDRAARSQTAPQFGVVGLELENPPDEEGVLRDFNFCDSLCGSPLAVVSTHPKPDGIQLIYDQADFSVLTSNNVFVDVKFIRKKGGLA